MCTPEDDDVLDPDDYTHVGRYHFHKTDAKMGWDEAEAECDRLGLSWIDVNDQEITEKMIQSEIGEMFASRLLQLVIIIQFCTSPDDVWINAHSPSGPNDMDKCHDTGTECANQGVSILGLSDVPINLDLFPEVKVEFKDEADKVEDCFKFKGDKGKGKLESEKCDSDKAAGCYAYCCKCVQILKVMSMLFMLLICFENRVH